MNAGRESLYGRIESLRFLSYWGVYNSPLADYSQTLLPDDSGVPLWKWCVDRFERPDTRSLTVVDLLSGP